MSATEGGSSDEKATTDNDICMGTPPSSPQAFSWKLNDANPMRDAANEDPPALADIASHPLSLSHEAQELQETVETHASRGAEMGRTIMTNPSTPVRVEAHTPGFGLGGGGGIAGGFHGAPISDLTPVISNSGAYVDLNLSSKPGTRPGIPGLPAGLSADSVSFYSSAADDEEFTMVGHPRNPLAGPRGCGRMSSRAAAVLEGGGPGSGGSRSSSSIGPSSPKGSWARELQRRRLPAMRVGLPLAKRPSAKGGCGGGGLIVDSAAATSAGVAASMVAFLRMPSSGFSPDSRDQMRASPSTPLTLSRGTSGTSEESCYNQGSLLGERPSVPGYSDKSSVDTSGSGLGVAMSKNTAALGGESSIFKRGENPGLAPIELKHDRKLCSFQGASQYRQRVESIQSPSRCPPASPKKEERGLPPSAAAAQYRPLSRGQHGVKEMADAEELDAIFKAPRRGTPDALVASALDQREGQQQPLISNIKGEEQDEQHHLSVPYPVESQWSIPSIRLANRVGQTPSSSGHPLDASFASCAEFSECTDEDGVSLDESGCHSFLEDDEASLSSRGSLDASARRRVRRVSGIFQLVRKPPSGTAAANRVPQTIPSWDASDVCGVEADDAGENPPLGSLVGQVVSPRTAMATSNSFPKKVRGTSIMNGASASILNSAMPWPQPTLTRRASTFDAEATPPIFSVNAALAAADDAAEYSRPRRNRSHNRRRRREGAAVEWLQELQDRSLNQLSERGSDVLIAEAASSKFLSVGGGVGGNVEIGGGGQRNRVPSTARMTSEDVAKALGMPHPLCRSSSIAGPFVRGVGGVFESRRVLC